MNKRKLWVCTLTTEIYVLSEKEPNAFDVERYVRDSYIDPEVLVRETKQNILGWDKTDCVFGPDEDVTVAEALVEVNP